MKMPAIVGAPTNFVTGEEGSNSKDVGCLFEGIAYFVSFRIMATRWHRLTASSVQTFSVSNFPYRLFILLVNQSIDSS